MAPEHESNDRQERDDRGTLAGIRVLVADDELLIALDIGAALADCGAEIVGPCTTVAQALDAVRNADPAVALLDLRIGRDTTEAVALALEARNIPFAFYSGQKLPDAMRGRWSGHRLIAKPAAQATLVGAVLRLLQR